MDFNVKILHVFEVFGSEIWITETILNAWIIMLLLIIVAVIVRISLKKWEQIPSGFQNVVEVLVEMFDKIVLDTAGEKLMYLGNWFFMVFAFMLMSSICGIIGLRPPTADWATTFAFALGTFFLIQAMGVYYRRGKYLKSFFEPFFLFLPLNLIGELSRPISLSFRIFGNVLAGMILMSLIYTLAPIFLRFLLPAALHAYFDLITGILQAYIFCILSLSFISDAAAVD